jgi:hypothetical protein
MAGVYVTIGGLTEILLAFPVANSMGMYGLERALTQIALGTLLTLGAILGGWLTSYAQHASRWQRIVISAVAASLIAGLLLVQARLAPIRGDIIAGQMNLSLHHVKALKALTISRGQATQLFLNLGRVVVGLGVTEGYVLHDPLTGAYRRASRAAAKSLADAAKYRTIAIERNIDSTIASASLRPDQAAWVAAAHSLRAAGSAAMSQYLGEVAALADEDTRAALYAAPMPMIPLPRWVREQDHPSPTSSSRNGQTSFQGSLKDR